MSDTNDDIFDTAFDNGFDPGFNNDFHVSQDQTSSVVSDLAGGAVASVVDFAGSVWNSLPGTDYADTADMLSRIDNNALRVYEEHPDAVHTASFIGGMFLPTGLALKGMTAMRAGARGATWFSNAGKAESLATIDKLFLEGAAATSEYRAAKMALYARGAANQVLDAAAMELALVGSMHAHPFMEDYMKDPIQNFATSLLLGGVIGGVVGHVADRFQVGKLEKVAESSIVNFLSKDLVAARPVDNFADQVMTHQVNIATLENIIQKESVLATVESNGRRIQTAQAYLLSAKNAQNEAFEAMLSPSILEATRADKALKDSLLESITSGGFKGASEVGYLTQKLDDSGNVLKMEAGKTSFMDKLVFAPKTTKIVDPITGETVTKSSLIDVAYSPELNRFYSLEDVKHYGRARDLGMNAEQLAKVVGKSDFPNLNIAEEIMSKNSASIDAHYLGLLKQVDDKSVAEVKAMILSADDIPTRNAIMARVAKEPEAFEGHKWKVTNNKPNYEAFNQQIIVSKAGTGVKASHLADNEAIVALGPKGLDKYDLLIQNLGDKADDAIQHWVSGNKKPLVEAMENMRLKDSAYVANGADEIGNAIYNSVGSKAARAAFLKNADVEGNVYLYRGLHKGKTVGHGALDSYTTSAAKAAEFGKPQLYKVHVDDIVAVVGDIPARGTTDRLNEIIVRAGTREVHATPATLPIAGAGEAKTIINKTGGGVAEHTAMELSQQLIDLKDSTISSMLMQRIPMETIAIRTNTPLDTIKAFALMPEGSSLVDVLNAVGHSEYNSAARIGEYLDPAKKTLRVKSDIAKQTFATLKANLDVRSAGIMQEEITSAVLAGSSSALARDLGAYFHSQERAPILGMLRAKIGEFVNSGSGNRFLTSSDAFARNMGDVGMVVNTIGKDMIHKTNKAIETILKPINDAYATIVQGVVDRAEYNVAVNVNAGIKGWREFRDGKFWIKEAALDAQGNATTILTPVTYKGKDFTVVSDSVKAVFAEHQKAGRELFFMRNTINQLLGKPDINDIGLWIPAFNPKNKFIAYVHNKLDDTTRMLWGNTPEELASAKAAFEATIPPHRLGKEISVVMPSEQAMWNRLNGRMDPLTMEVANVSMQHGGSSAGAVVKANADILGEISGGYEHYIGANMRQIAEISMHDVMDGLTRMSQYNVRMIEGQTLGAVEKFLYAPKDTANIIKNTLLGNSNLKQYESWRNVNQSFETGLSMTMTKVGQIWNEAIKPFIPTIRKGKEIESSHLSNLNYEEISKRMEAVGAVNPWANFDQEAARVFGLAKLTDHKDTSKRVIYASNALAATVALRIGELAQPLVNAMSLPILTSLAVANKMPETFMGIQKATTKVGGVQVMYEGARAMHDPSFESLRKMWKEAGYFDPMVSEANNTLKLSRNFDKGAISSVEKALDSNLVKVLSKPADWSESYVRAQTMHTGAVLAKRLYPELDNTGITIFARDFMDRAVGNYHSSQRPVFFQGTMGVALGLFQTYMLTLGQSIYRHLELKNYKALGTAALTQSTVFGTASLPGFNVISETIGNNFSDNNVDLTTGTYRALPDATANLLLYGLPSSMGPAFYTRGEIAPRVPTAPGELVAVSMVKQTMDMIGHVSSALKSDQPDLARSLGEALSMQSMSRPLARGAELLTGTSVTSKGNTVSVPEEVWTPVGVMSRVLGTRPLEEAKLRQAMHLNTMYGSADHKNRQELQMKLKTAIRGDTLNDELVAKIAADYMRNGGTVEGWNSAKNTVIAQTNMSGRTQLLNKLKPDNPLNFMIDNL